jgi:hypothetical protein
MKAASKKPKTPQGQSDVVLGFMPDNNAAMK